MVSRFSSLLAAGEDGNSVWPSRIRRLSVLGVLAAVVAAVALGQAKKPLTNDDIIKLAEASFQESVIISAIEANDAAFDVSPDALLALRAKNVGEGVIRAMLTATKNRGQSSGSSGPGPVSESRVSGPPVVSQVRPNFSGFWEVDKARSVFKGPKELTSEFDRMTAEIRHEDPKLEVILTQTDGALVQTITYPLTTDRAENSLLIRRGHEMVSKTYWEGDRLVSESRHTVQAQGKKPVTFDGRVVRALTGDGRTLVWEERVRFRRTEAVSRIVLVKR